MRNDVTDVHNHIITSNIYQDKNTNIISKAWCRKYEYHEYYNIIFMSTLIIIVATSTNGNNYSNDKKRGL